MNYEEQSRKDKPFEGLSQEEAKRLFVYMCYVAHPRFTPEDVEKRWGKVLPSEEIPTVFETMEIAEKMKRTDNHIQQDSQVIATPPGKGATAWKAVALILVVLGVMAAILIDVHARERKEAIRRQEKMRQKEIIKQEEMRKKEELRQQKKQLQQETTGLIKAATSLLSSTTASPKEFLEMGLKLQMVREKMISDQSESRHSENKENVEELLLRCYKRARGKCAPFYNMSADPFSIDACYRISLLYTPNKYRVVDTDSGPTTILVENNDVSMKYLKEAVECNHYLALWQLTYIFYKDCSEYRRYINTIHPDAVASWQRDHLQNLEQQAEMYGRQLANHNQATSNDVYAFAQWISKRKHDEALMWFKKAARMGHLQAKKELMLEGFTLDD